MAILIVEDNPVSSRLVEQILKKYDFETLMASNGVEALEILSKDPSSIDIVITDIMMPEMDGLALAKTIKTSPHYEHIPVIVCTVLRDLDNIKKAASIGCRHYLLKPYRPEELRAKVLECHRHEKKVIRSQAEIMSLYHLKDEQYAEIRGAFRQLLENYVSFTDEKLKRKNNGDFDLVNIQECAVIFGTERLKFLLEQHEKREGVEVDNPDLNNALLSEMRNVVKALSK